MGSPRLDARWFKNLCQLGPRPLIATAWFKVWMQGHFGSAANIESTNPSLTRALWNLNFKQSGILIESVTRWVPESTEQRPAIIIKRGSFKKRRLGIDDRNMGMIDTDFQNVYGNVWIGSHTLFCIAGEGGEVELLAAEVWRELNEFGPIVRLILDLMRFEVVEVGEVMPLATEAREKNFVVPITVDYAFRQDWKVRQEAPNIKRLDLAVFQP